MEGLKTAVRKQVIWSDARLELMAYARCRVACPDYASKLFMRQTFLLVLSGTPVRAALVSGAGGGGSGGEGSFNCCSDRNYF